jgi:hypothetical protein
MRTPEGKLWSVDLPPTLLPTNIILMLGFVHLYWREEQPKNLLGYQNFSNALTFPLYDPEIRNGLNLPIFTNAISSNTRCEVNMIAHHPILFPLEVNQNFTSWVIGRVI